MVYLQVAVTNNSLFFFYNHVAIKCVFLCGTAIEGVRSFTQEEEAEPRIVGGKEAWPHSWPWQVVLSFANMPACGGAILSQYWIITAGHCFKR